MGHINTMADAAIVAALAAALLGYLYLRYSERRRRLEIIHQERLAAMEKGIPLPEFPLETPKVPLPPNPRNILIHGIAWTALGGGGVATFAFLGGTPTGTPLWPLPLPLLFLGIGLTLYYVLASNRPR